MTTNFLIFSNKIIYIKFQNTRNYLKERNLKNLIYVIFNIVLKISPKFFSTIK